MSKTPRFQLPHPLVCEGSNQEFSLDSTIIELQLWQFSVETNCPGIEVAKMFEKYPLLPGVILVEQEHLIGAISRRRFLEYLLLPHGTELFLNQPLDVLYAYAKTEILIIPQTETIIHAAGMAFRRSPEQRGEPIIVQTTAQTYLLLDTTELSVAAWQIRGIETQVRYERIQTQMIQSEKMASLGRLVDGIAHEILDPVSFIWGNLSYVSLYSQNLLELLQIYEKLTPKPSSEVLQLKADIEFDYIQQDLTRAIKSITSGATRLKQLALSLQNFCHIDEVYPKPADINGLLDGILLLLKSQLSNEIKIIRNFGKLPPVNCFAGQLNQVFMNILTNAMNALLNQAVYREFADKSPTDDQPHIEISTALCTLEESSNTELSQRWVTITITDNGPGLSPKLYQQILESFTVEKRVEKETSLALSYRIVTSKHGGKFNLRSQFGSGTTFEILLPLI